MKFTAVIVSALAAVASAAPTQQQQQPEARAAVDASLFNNFAFNNQAFQYLNVVNSLNLGVLQQLASVNNLNLNNFAGLFSNNQFNVNSLLQLQQIQNLIQLQQLGVLSGFDLSTLSLNQLNFGLINNVGGVDLATFIDSSLAPQIQTVIQQQTVTAVVKD